MKFTCDKNDLARGVSRVQNVVASKTTLPILANVLLETQGSRLRLLATDMEVGMETSVAGEVQRAGAVTIPAKRLSEIARELPEGPVTIEVGEESRVTIATGAITYKIFGMARDEYPGVPEVKGEHELTLAGAELKRMIAKTSFAVSTDVTRYTLNGVFWVMKEKELRLVATDGHRLCMMTHGLAKKAKGEVEAIVPTKALDELVRMVDADAEGEVRIAFGTGHLLAEGGGATLFSRLIEGQFPKYEQVIPKESDRKVTCATDRFLKAVRRTSLVAADRTSSVRVDLTKGKMTVSAQTPEVGEAREEIEIQLEGKDLSLAFNAKYVQDVLRHMETPEVTLEASGPAAPVLVKPSGATDYVAVVMPMRL